MPLFNKNKSEAATPPNGSDMLDDFFLAHLESCGICRSATDDKVSTSQSFLAQAARLELLSEPEFQEAVSTLQGMSVDDITVADHSLPQLDIGSQVGSYRILEPIACGGMGQVYRAVHVDLGKVVAVKVLSPQRAANAAAINRFRREMKILGQFTHQHVVCATDGGEDDGRFYLVMEYVDGLDLSSLVASLGPLPVVDAAELIRQAALGVQAIHQQGFVHRDIKPSNLMLSREAVVKVLDLGLSRFAEMESGVEELTEAGRILGTRQYMAPEQFESSQVGAQADLYSLGASFMTLLSGTHPSLPKQGILSAEASDLQKREADAPLLQRTDVPNDLADLLARLASLDPSDRPRSAKELADALQPHCEGSDLKKLLICGLGQETTIGRELHAKREHTSTKARSRSARRVILMPLLIVLSVVGAWLLFAALRTMSISNISPNKQEARSAQTALNPPSPGSQTPIQQQQERDVARWVLMKGGRVVRHPHGDIRSADEIPPDGPFRVRSISLVDQGVADVDLLPFLRLSMLDTLILSNNPSLTNRGLAELARIKTLRWLYVGGTQINDNAIPSLNDLSNLETLGLGNTAVSDNGLQKLVDLEGLRELQLNKTRVTDAGLQHLKNLPNLVRLDLTSTRVTDTGLEALVKSAKTLEFLTLDFTKITGEGVRHLEGLRQLKSLSLKQTDVTLKQVETLRRALPLCEVTF